MPKHIRKIDHKGDLYYSLDDIIDLLDETDSIDDLKSILIPKDENKLSDFNKKLAKGLSFNPKQDVISKKECEEKLKEHRRLIGKVFNHKSGSHKISITDVKCVSDITTNEYYVNCNYDNLTNNMNGVISAILLSKNYSLSAIDRM